VDTTAASLSQRKHSRVFAGKGRLPPDQNHLSDCRSGVHALRNLLQPTEPGENPGRSRRCNQIRVSGGIGRHCPLAGWEGACTRSSWKSEDALPHPETARWQRAGRLLMRASVSRGGPVCL